MKRREFILALGGAAATCPLAARAQQPERMRRIGVLMNASADDKDGQARIIAFVQALQEFGWTDGRNARLDIRWGAGDGERYRRYATELVALAPDVILAPTSPVVAALQRVTSTVPVVFTGVIDPVGAGFVANLARPGGNDRLRSFRIRRQREMARTAQRDRARRHARGDPSGPVHSSRDRPACRDAGGGAVTWGGIEPARYSRR
jgi:putative tryptophan/tyrosine transport system substrate-binding protein